MTKPEGRPNKKPRLNDLDGRTWTRYSISVWDIAKTPKEVKLRHPAMFPLELCKRLIEIYTKKGDVVLDPFLGSGSTIVAAKDLERVGIGVEVNPEYVKLVKKRLSQQKLTQTNVKEPKVYLDDAINIDKILPKESVDFVLTSPPYWSIHKRKRTADYKESRPYSELKEDIGNIEDYSAFFKTLGKIFLGVHKVMKPGKKCVVIVMDIRVKSDFFPFHIDVIDKMKKLGFILDDIIIWDRKQEYSNLRPLGYPYVFIVNKIHEYILIFSKKKKSEGG